MGRRGPKPEPAAVKKAKGNPGRRSLGEEPTVIGADRESRIKPIVSPPSWLKDESRKIWNRFAPNLAALKLLSQTDAETFARYCRSFSRWLEMQERIDKEGLTVHIESKHGEWDRPHPLLMPCDRLEVRLQSFEDRFGLNPAERQRIFAARAVRPGAGDLFPEAPGSRAPQPKRPDERSSPVGRLN